MADDVDTMVNSCIYDLIHTNMKAWRYREQLFSQEDGKAESWRRQGGSIMKKALSYRTWSSQW